MTSTKSKEIAEEYISSLADLTINSKPLINMLTMLAEDNTEHAPAIVKAVENHLQKVKSEIKLPVLYLIDSIVKNVNGAYLKLFEENIVNTFCCVFEKVDESTRASMWKLRQTWNEVFKAQKLYSLDIRVHNIDPAWPITAPSPTISSGSIHVNPRFLSMSPSPTAKPPPAVEPVSVSEAVMREQLLKKQRELLELQKQKIELELLQAKSNLEQQQRQLDKQASCVKTEMTIPTAHVVPTTDTQQGKPVAPVVPSQITKQVAKQFPAATASLLKNVGNNNGPRIAPAGSLLVASARMPSRDPRIKSSNSNQESLSTISGDTDIRGRADTNENHSDNIISTSSQNCSSSSSYSPSLSSSNNEKSNAPSKSSSSSSSSSHRKVGSKSRPKQPQASPNKLSKIDHDASPIRSKSREKNNLDGNSSSRISPQSMSQSSSKNRKKSSSSSSSNSNSCNNNSNSSSNNNSNSNNNSGGGGSSSSSSKSRKRSPSPPYRIPRRNAENKSNSSSSLLSLNSGGLTEEEQSGSLIVSPPHPPTFKEIKSNTRQRNYIRRNKDSASPEHHIHNSSIDNLIESSSKDEDLRANITGTTTVASLSEKKEDLDLRILPPPNSKRSSDHIDSNPKKSKTEKFDALFGNEDVDLRTLTHPKVRRPPTPPPPVISGEDTKASWAKIKTPSKNDRDKTVNDDKHDKNRNKDRLGRPRFYSKLSDDLKDRRRAFGNDDDTRSNRKSRDLDKPDRNSDRNIEIIIKQAKEQLDQGSISNSDYHKLVRECWQINEDQKLRAALRKEKEIGSIVWEKGIDIGNFSPKDNDMNHRGKDHSHMRNGPRWHGQPWQQPPGPWIHSQGTSSFGHFNQDYRAAIGPWQNTAHFRSPIRPDFNQFHGFNAPIGPNPRMASSLIAPIGPNGPIIHGPIIPSLNMPNTSIQSLNGPNSILMNGPPPLTPHHQPPSLLGPLPSLSTASNTITSSSATANNNSTNNIINNINSNANSNSNMNIGFNSMQKFDLDDSEMIANSKIMKDIESSNRDLPLPDPNVLEEISKDTMKSINIDNMPREIRYYGHTGVVFMNWDDPREIGFQEGTRGITIDEKDTVYCSFNDNYKEFIHDGDIHRIKFGAPTRELFIDDKWYECRFDGPPIKVDLGNKKITIKLEGPPPQVKIGTVKRTDLVVAKINLIINAKSLVPVFLDSKPQVFEIDGQPQTLEFIDSLETVLINGRSFKVEFGGLPKPITIKDKKHFIRFSVLPRGVRAGFVKIANMKGKTPENIPIDIPSLPPPPPPPTLSSPLVTNLLSNAMQTVADSLSSIGAATNTLLPSTTIAANTTSLSMSSSTTAVASSLTTTTTTSMTSAKAMTSSPPPQTMSTIFEPDSTSQDASDNLLFKSNSLDVLSSALSSAMAPMSGISYQAEPVTDKPDVNATASILPLNVNIDDLFQRLVEAGIVPKLGVQTETNKPEEEKVKKESKITPVSFDKPETLKLKQPPIALALYSGMQCSSCGARFAPESATRYSQHLDWHFRQNRRERDLARKAHSRSWYYDVSDWIQYEEIEDLEDRAQNWFESEKQTAETEGLNSEESFQETIQPSVPTTSDEDARCQVCHDAFEQFYNEEKEEWHLRPTVTFEDKNYHPLCLEDHKRSLEKSLLADSIAEAEEEKKDEQSETSSTVKEQTIENEKTEEDENLKEDSTLKVESVEASLIDDKTSSEENIKDNTNEENVPENDAIQGDLLKNTENNEEAADDDDDDVRIEEANEDDDNVKIIENVIETINIKEEPIDYDEEETAMEMYDCNIEIKTEPVDPEPEPEEPLVNDAAALVDTTLAAVKSSIDGNFELDSTPQTLLSAPSKIKINITKPIVSNKESDEVKEKPAVPDKPNESEQPLVPASIKPAFQGKKLSILPPIEKGQDLSGLCSIM